MTTTNTTVDPCERLRDQLAGLADILGHLGEHRDELAQIGQQPYVAGGARGAEVSIMTMTADEMAIATRIVTAGAPIGAVTKTTGDEYIRVTRTFGAANLEAWTARATTCERKVVGVETVMVPDPEHVVPLVAVEREIVEWDCTPILTAADARTVAEDERNMQDNALDDYADAQGAR